MEAAEGLGLRQRAERCAACVSVTGLPPPVALWLPIPVCLRWCGHGWRSMLPVHEHCAWRQTHAWRQAHAWWRTRRTSSDTRALHSTSLVLPKTGGGIVDHREGVGAL